MDNNSTGSDSTDNTIGLVLALASGAFIGGSFIIKKKGLLNCMEKDGAIAGEGHAYLKSLMWWVGMLMMVVGEACNFVAYAFTAALIVTPLGALSVVISAVLAHFILRERLNSQGKIGCALCILGAIIIVLHAPEQSVVNQVDDFLNLVIAPAFLVYMGVVLIASLILIFYCGPRWGKTHMLVYITICSIIGSVSVQFTQGFGAAIVYSFKVKGQWGHWFLWVSLVVMVITLLLEINYLNKALNLFNTAMVTPVYYVIFTTCCILASAILYQGFKAEGRDIATIVIGFLVTCAGVALLQLSRGSSDPAELPILEANKPQEDLPQHAKSTMEMVGVEQNGQPILRPRNRTTQELGRSRSLYAEFEAGPLAMRSNPLASWRRSRVIAEEMSAQRRFHLATTLSPDSSHLPGDRRGKGSGMVDRRHTFAAGGLHPDQRLMAMLDEKEQEAAEYNGSDRGRVGRSDGLEKAKGDGTGRGWARRLSIGPIGVIGRSFSMGDSTGTTLAARDQALEEGERRRGDAEGHSGAGGRNFGRRLSQLFSPRWSHTPTTTTTRAPQDVSIDPPTFPDWSQTGSQAGSQVGSQTDWQGTSLTGSTGHVHFDGVRHGRSPSDVSIDPIPGTPGIVVEEYELARSDDSSLARIETGGTTHSNEEHQGLVGYAAASPMGTPPRR